MHSSASKSVTIEPAAEPEAAKTEPRRFADIEAIHPFTKKALKSVFKYDNMSVVQDAVLSRLPDNKDIFVKAKTGTGKTLAFLVAALETATNGKVIKHPEGNLILVVSPTRELAHQIANEANRLIKYYPYKVHCLVGGDPKVKQLRQLDFNRGDIIVATPGRLIDILESSKHARRLVEHTKVLVLDEADQLIDMGFKQEVERILTFLPKERQTMLFSATLSPEIRNTIGKFALSPDYELVDTVGEEEVNTHLHVKQSAIVAPYSTQITHLRSLLHTYPAANAGKTIVFMPTTKSTALYAKLLKFLMPQRNVLELHSKMNQNSRTRISARFRKSLPGTILVTSDVSARGVDYPDVSLVVQVGMPSSREQYIHRLGRTGRAGKDGEGVIIIAPFETSFIKEEINDLPIENLIPPPPKEDEKEETSKILSYVLEHRVEEEEIREIYTAYLGYYSSRMMQLNQPRSDALIHAKDFLNALGVTEIPHLSARFIEQLGLKNRNDRRSSSMSSNRGRSSNSRFGQDRRFDRRGDGGSSRFGRWGDDEGDRRGSFDRSSRQNRDDDDRRGGSRYSRWDDSAPRRRYDDERAPRQDYRHDRTSKLLKRGRRFSDDE
ncbi:P-loop containing nucleoside triphosphate hydrolase protein [Dichotomocladium elegans]|nr:P-loop containing nucleoside triphosphate hydrolase protein [Dichotomocladium elegans]